MADKVLRPKLIVIAGPNGSGKTTFTNQILRHDWSDGCTFINPDEIARNEFGDWNSPPAVKKAVVRAGGLSPSQHRVGGGVPLVPPYGFWKMLK